jgi:transposase
MADLFWLSDAQWAVMEPFMPRNRAGARRVDDRRTHFGECACDQERRPVAGLPTDCDPHTTVYNRFSTRSRRASGELC